MKRYYFLLMALLLLAACTKSETDTAAVQQLHNSPDFHASFEAEDTRTFVDEKVRLLWTEGDQLSIFTSTLNQKYEFDGETGDNSGTFTPISSGQFGSGSSLSVDANFAVYPYNQSTKISYDGDLSIELPSTQAYAEDSFGVNANTMVAATKSQNDYFLSFKNLGGFLKLQLYGDVTVKSIQLKGNSGEKIAGAATVVAKSGKNPTLTMSNTATDAITLDCGAGVKLGTSAGSATEFWIVVPPVTFTKGFTITITDTEGGTMTKSTSKSYTVERNVMKSMTAFEVETEQPVQILYTSTDGSVITPNTTAFGGAKIVSNVYENGQGVITFDKKITSLPAEAFQSKTKLVTISLPESVTSIGNYAFFNCTLLSSINLPKYLSDIGRYVFAGCSSLASITIPDSLTVIGGYTFDRCTSLDNVYITDLKAWCNIDFGYASNPISGAKLYINEELVYDLIIPEGVKKIKDYAFYGCANLKSVTIPNSVTEIGYAAFGSISIERVIIGKGVKTIGENAFDGCTKLKGVYISDLAAWCNINFSNPTSNPTTRYTSDLYLNGALVEDLTIPNGIEKIKDYAFMRCKSIKSVTIPDGAMSIGCYAFADCKLLESIVIPNGVTEIKDYALSYCTALTNITIPKSVTYLGYRLCLGCKSLNIYCKPTNPPSLGYETFISIEEPSKIYVPKESIDVYKNAKEWKTYEKYIEGYDF